MERTARFLTRRYDLLLIALTLGGALLLNLLPVHKANTIVFCFLPVLLAGWLRGVGWAIAVSMAAMSAILLTAAIAPSLFGVPADTRSVFSHLGVWAGVLLLSAIVVGRLRWWNEMRLAEVRAAYAGLLEILFSHLKSAGKGLESHVGRVAEQAAHLAKRLGLSGPEIEIIRVAALLHEIGELRVPPYLVYKAANLSCEEKRAMAARYREAQTVFEDLGAILHHALPTAIAHHHLCADSRLPADVLGQASISVQILHLADAYDVLTSAQRLSPTEAAFEILRPVAGGIRPDLADAFAKVAELSGTRRPEESRPLGLRGLRGRCAGPSPVRTPSRWSNPKATSNTP